MAIWNTRPFNELYAEPSKNGLMRPKSVRGVGYKMVNMGELFAYNRIRNPEMDLVLMSETEKEKYSIKVGDLLFARQSLIASGAGKCSVVLEAPELTTFESHIIRVRLDHTKAEPLFYYYYFSSPAGKNSTQSLVMQVAAAGIRASELALLYVPCPPLPTQRKIAAILSAYDDLIENNMRRIAILEEMAQSLYREWFVYFRFPGYEKNRMVESALGMIPERWEVKTFAEVADFVNGFAFKPDDWGKLGKPIVKIVELKNGVTDRTPFHDGSNIPQKYHIQNGDILFSWSADLDVYIWGGGPALLNQHLFHVLPYNGFTKLFLFYSLKDRMWDFRSKSQGTTMKHIKRSALEQVRFLVPPFELRSMFEEHAIPLRVEVQNLTTKNLNLRRTRDLLLPKLISGEVDVEGLDIDIGEVMSTKDAGTEPVMDEEVVLADEQKMTLWG